jgi:ubiquinone/menaquinone biosynthesis C-methylase UbiE
MDVIGQRGATSMGETGPDADLSASPPVQDVYTPGYGSEHRQELAGRAAANNAAFLLPHLRSGMALLDCGCGVGSITRGLAEIVAPGEAVGVDIEPGQVDAARHLAARAGTTNLRFEVADVAELPFSDGSFDAVFAHGLMEHVRDPLDAIKEMRRVLKPGGVVGVADIDWGTALLAPSSPLLDAFLPLYLRYRTERGSSPTYARLQKRLLFQAGFARCVGSATAVFWGTPAALEQFKALWSERIHQTDLGETVLGQGWVDAPSWKAITEEFLAWCGRPDALALGVRCEAIGWADEVAARE